VVVPYDQMLRGRCTYWQTVMWDAASMHGLSCVAVGSSDHAVHSFYSV